MPSVTTTASSTHCSKRPSADPLSAERLDAHGRRDFLRGLLLVWTASAVVGAPVPARAQSAHNASVTQMRLERSDDGIYLNANVDFQLPTLIQEVLDKGIAIHFVAEAEVFRERWYWTDRRVAHATRQLRVAFQPLTRRWRVNVVPTNGSTGLGVQLNQNFDTLDDALESVKRIGRLRLGDVGDIAEDTTHLVVFRFKLDTSQLPRPFQIGVVGLADWDISVERSARLAMEKSP
jgi:predicted transport protein